MNKFVSLLANDVSIPLCPKPDYRIGVLVLESDHGIENELLQIVPANVRLHFIRMKDYSTDEGNPKLRQDSLSLAANMLNAIEDLDAVIYGCTSGELYFGYTEVKKRIQSSAPNIPVIATIDCLIKEIEISKTTEISILSPYETSLNNQLIDYLLQRNVSIKTLFEFPMANSRDMSLVNELFFEEFAYKHANDIDQLLFVPCNALSIVSAIPRMQRILQAKVITSSEIVMRYALAASGTPSLNAPNRLDSRSNTQDFRSKVYV